MRTRTKKRKKTGSNVLRRCGYQAVAVLLIWAAPLLLGAGTNKGKKPVAPQAILAGTVFRENGASLPGAEVEIEPLTQPNSTHKVKRINAVSDARGEFAVRVPTDEMDYKVSAKAPGYEPQVKTVKVSGEVRVDVFFRLEPASRQ